MDSSPPPSPTAHSDPKPSHDKDSAVEKVAQQIVNDVINEVIQSDTDQPSVSRHVYDVGRQLQR